MVFKRLKKNQGFTVVELIVSMVILILLSTVVLAGFRASKRQKELEYQADKVVTVINKVQNLALTGTGPRLSGGSIPYYGLRVSADQRSLIIFADMDQMFDYDSGEDLVGGVYALNSRFKIQAVDYSDLYFAPTTGEIYNASGPITSEFQAYKIFDIYDTAQQRILYINGRVGRVTKVTK